MRQNDHAYCTYNIHGMIFVPSGCFSELQNKALRVKTQSELQFFSVFWHPNFCFFQLCWLRFFFFVFPLDIVCFSFFCSQTDRTQRFVEVRRELLTSGRNNRLCGITAAPVIKAFLLEFTVSRESVILLLSQIKTLLQTLSIHLNHELALFQR